MTVRKFRRTIDRHIRMQPYSKLMKEVRHGSNGLLPATLYLPLYIAPSTPEMTGR